MECPEAGSLGCIFVGAWALGSTRFPEDWPEAGNLGCVSESALGSGGEFGSRFAGIRVVRLNA